MIQNVRKAIIINRIFEDYPIAKDYFLETLDNNLISKELESKKNMRIFDSKIKYTIKKILLYIKKLWI